MFIAPHVTDTSRDDGSHIDLLIDICKQTEFSVNMLFPSCHYEVIAKDMSAGVDIHVYVPVHACVYVYMYV